MFYRENARATTAGPDRGRSDTETTKCLAVKILPTPRNYHSVVESVNAKSLGLATPPAMRGDKS
jgi:hypothetical protein